jgi:hypothetical protein
MKDRMGCDCVCGGFWADAAKIESNAKVVAIERRRTVIIATGSVSETERFPKAAV